MDFHSRMFNNASQSEMLNWQRVKPTLSSHVNGTTMKEWNSYPALPNFFNLITTSDDENGQDVVTAMESKKYPIYGVQFHPEVIMH
jgi:anthranilate/para-aminobenzoate synthase component II